MRLDFQGITNGILAGLVSVTAGCDIIETWAAFCIGIIGSFVYCFSCVLMQKLKIDDPLEASQVHGFCGAWGCIAVAFFAKDIGIVYGHADSGKLLGYQITGCLCIAAWSGGLSAFYFTTAQPIRKVVHKFDMFRTKEKDELIGGDLHYFGPSELDASMTEIDLRTCIKQEIANYAHKG